MARPNSPHRTKKDTPYLPATHSAPVRGGQTITRDCGCPHRIPRTIPTHGMTCSPELPPKIKIPPSKFKYLEQIHRGHKLYPNKAHPQAQHSIQQGSLQNFGDPPRANTPIPPHKGISQVLLRTRPTPLQRNIRRYPSTHALNIPIPPRAPPQTEGCPISTDPPATATFHYGEPQPPPHPSPLNTLPALAPPRADKY